MFEVYMLTKQDIEDAFVLYLSGMGTKKGVEWEETDNGRIYKDYITFPTYSTKKVVVKEYYDGNRLAYRCCYLNGYLNGKAVCYCKNGKVFIETNYKDGVMHGKFIRRYKNGKIQCLIHYIDGEPITP